MAFAQNLRAVFSRASSSSSILQSQLSLLRFNATLTSPKLFVSDWPIKRGCISDLWKWRITNKVLKGSGTTLIFDEFWLYLLRSTGLSRLTTDEKLKEAFVPFGQLIEAKVIVDRATGRSKGFGFVTYADIEEAQRAREEMNAKFLDGWVIFVDPAKPRETRSPPQFESQPQQSGFSVNKTVGWCGQ